jgi:muconolactone delta-isomerase
MIALSMPIFTVLSRVDAYVDYVAEVEADSAEEAADLAYEGDPSVIWQELGVVEFDARWVVALDDDGEEIEDTARGKG